MDIKIIPIGIDVKHIQTFRKMVATALKKSLTDAEMSTLLIHLGSMDAWPQLQKLEKMEAIIRSSAFDQKQNQAFVESFLYLSVLVQDKIILAYLDLLKNSND